MDNQASNLTLAIVVIVLGAVGTYLLLPHRHGNAKPKIMHVAGGILAAIALILFARFWQPPDPFLTRVFFYAFSFAAVAGGLLTITSRNPIYSALWFASVVLSTSGLYLIAGAQFLAAGTVIVYAGAIIVTFLFVIMLAQMEGRALYDRSSRSPFRATMTCFLLFWALLYSLFLIRPPAVGIQGVGPSEQHLVRTLLAKSDRPAAAVLERASRVTSQLTDLQGRVKPHVAGLGEALFTDHLVTVELAGTLLFVALIGALAIAAPKPPIRPGDRPSVPPAKPKSDPRPSLS